MTISDIDTYMASSTGPSVLKDSNVYICRWDTKARGTAFIFSANKCRGDASGKTTSFKLIHLDM